MSESEPEPKSLDARSEILSSEIFDLCEIFDLLLFVSSFSSQSKGTRCGDYFFDVCCVN